MKDNSENDMRPDGPPESKKFSKAGLKSGDQWVAYDAGVKSSVPGTQASQWRACKPIDGVRGQTTGPLLSEVQGRAEQTQSSQSVESVALSQ